MSITLHCQCGKGLRIADEHAGKPVKCPVCGAIQKAVAQAAALAQPPPHPEENSDDFDVVEDSPAQAMQNSTPSKPRLKAIAEEEPKTEPAPPPTATPSAKAKKKKQKKKAGLPNEGDEDWYENMRANEAWMRRVLRGSAFIVLGLIILGGVAIVYFGYREDLNWLQDEGGRGVMGLILLSVIGLAAVGKGVIGLVFGQFLGDDDD